MLLVKTYLAESSIAGIGLFAGEPITRGTKIWELREGFDVVFEASLPDTLPEVACSFLLDHAYEHHSDPSKMILDGDNCRFLNHADDPNLDFSNRHACCGYANRDIAEGEELTCNYKEFGPRLYRRMLDHQ